jgi:pilus assembly protein CpaE
MKIGRCLHLVCGKGRKAQSFPRDEAGVSAIEFGLVAPLIFFSLLAMIDVGFAIRDRILLDHFLRSGAQAAFRDSGEVVVLDTLNKTVCRDNETYPICADLTSVSFVPAPDRYCVCPTTGELDTTCSGTCAVKKQKFYKLSAAKSYTGIFLPEMNFATSVLVEVE